MIWGPSRRVDLAEPADAEVLVSSDSERTGAAELLAPAEAIIHRPHAG